MWRAVLTVVAASMAAACLTSGASAGRAAPRTDPCVRAAAATGVDAAPDRLRSALRCLVRDDRHRHGRRALTAAGGLNAAALGHAADMVRAGYFSHVSRDGRTPLDRAQDAGYAPRGWRIVTTGETLAWAAGPRVTASDLFRTLLRSRAHRAVLRSARFRHIGVAVQRGVPRAGAGRGATLVVVLGRRARTTTP